MAKLLHIFTNLDNLIFGKIGASIHGFLNTKNGLILLKRLPKHVDLKNLTL